MNLQGLSRQCIASEGHRSITLTLACRHTPARQLPRQRLVRTAASAAQSTQKREGDSTGQQGGEQAAAAGEPKNFDGKILCSCCTTFNTRSHANFPKPPLL